MSEPTRWQYFVAAEYPSYIWVWGWTVSVATLGVYYAFPLVLPPAGWIEYLLFAVCVIIAPLLGFFGCILPGWFVLGPLYFSVGESNGRGYGQGVRVRVLTGPHKDEISTVYDVWQMGDYAGATRVRVDLGDEAKADYSDVFSKFQVMKITE